MLKKLLYGLLSLVLIVVLLVVCVFGLRMYNGKNNEALSKDMSKYMKDPGNIKNYPENIDGMTLKHIDRKSAQGFHMIPDTIKHKGILVIYGGSEGSPNFDVAASYAKQGYEVLSMFMFGQKNQPKMLSKVPLEQFEDVLSYIKNNTKNSDTITVLGASKGAEYALNLATKYKEINHVILIAPSAYQFNGLDFSDLSSSWTYQGKELPYINVQKGDMSKFLKDAFIPMIINSPITYRTSYDAAIEHDKEADKKLIPVKDTQADLLIIAGEDDQMWNSSGMAKKIKQERPEKTKVHIYKDAGHIFAGNGVLAINSMAIKTGGSEKMNTIAFKDSNKVILYTLKKWHQ